MHDYLEILLYFLQPLDDKRKMFFPVCLKFPSLIFSAPKLTHRIGYHINFEPQVQSKIVRRASYGVMLFRRDV